MTSIGAASTEVIGMVDDEPQVHADDRVFSSEQACQNGSQCELCKEEPAELLGVLGEGHRSGEPFLGHPAHLCGCEELGVPDDRDRQRE